MPRVLLTRPAEDAVPVIDALRKIGVETASAPLLNIHFESGPVLDLSEFQGVLLTSANGVRALARRTARRDISAYAVGDATARAAVDTGFSSVYSATGDVDALIELVAERCRSADGPFLHAAGSLIAGDLAGQLSEKGFAVHREKLYTAESASALPTDAVDALTTGSVDGVLVYSPRTSKTFDDVMAKADLSGTAKNMTLFALSQNVSNATHLPWARRIIAERPEQQSLLDAVRSCYY